MSRPRRKAAPPPEPVPPAPEHEAPSQESVHPAALGALVLAELLFLVLKSYAVRPARGDEGIYFYDALRVSEGTRLYRDLFFAHPPMQLVPLVALTKLFGYRFTLLKWLPSLEGAAQGVCAFLLGRRAFRSDLAAAFAAIALLFAPDFLKASSHETGIMLADLLLFSGIALLLANRPGAGGIVAGLGVTTLLQTAPVAAVAALAALVHERKRGLRFLAFLALTFAVVNLAALALGGGAYLDEVYLFHLHKVAAEGAGAKQLGFFVADDGTLVGGGLLGAAFGLFFTKERKIRGFFAACLVAIILQLVAMATRPTVFPFYFQPAYLPLALAFAGAVALGVQRVRTGPALKQKLAGAAILATVLLVPQLAWGPVIDLVSPQRAGQRHTYAQTYEWKDSPSLGALNDVVRSLFWSGGVREADHDYASVTEYLWTQSRGFDSYEALVEAVRNAVPPEATLFGDSLTVPLVALGAGRRISLDLADTNVQRFRADPSLVETTIAQLETRGPPQLVISAAGDGLFRLPRFQEWVATNYLPIAEFADGQRAHYTLHRRR